MPSRGSLSSNALVVVASASTFALAFCFSRSPSEPPVAPVPASASATEAYVGYPRARFWRDPTMNDVVVDVSHVLVTHAGSSDVDSWMPRRISTRTREQALERASTISDRIRRRPTEFGRIAEAESDDEATAELGGRIGPTLAVALPRNIVDAFASLGEGEVSGPIETPAGFHVVTWRRAPVDPSAVAAEQILISYDRVSGGATERSRAEARARIAELRARATAHPESFLAIARTASDAPRAAIDADWGAHLPYDRGVSPIAARILAETAVGGITPVLDTAQGFVVLRRTDAVRRESIDAAFLVRPLEPGEDPSATVRELRRLRARLATTPDAFDAERAARCAHALCERASWSFRRGDFEHVDVESILLALDPGSIAATPVVVPGAVLLVKRLASTESVRRFRDSFPDNSAWSLDESIARLDGARLGVFLSQFRADVVDSLVLSADASARMESILESLRNELPRADSDDRVRLMDEAMSEVRLTLDDETFSRFEARRDAWFATLTTL